MRVVAARIDVAAPELYGVSLVDLTCAGADIDYLVGAVFLVVRTVTYQLPL